ncbi:MAG: hypothetical protein K5880_14585 [Hydrogenophaga sp.]|nr:hypothetical protein [Hydrogenophaga sp.]
MDFLLPIDRKNSSNLAGANLTTRLDQVQVIAKSVVATLYEWIVARYNHLIKIDHREFT